MLVITVIARSMTATYHHASLFVHPEKSRLFQYERPVARGIGNTVPGHVTVGFLQESNLEAPRMLSKEPGNEYPFPVSLVLTLRRSQTGCVRRPYIRHPAITYCSGTAWAIKSNSVNWCFLRRGSGSDPFLGA